MMRNPPACSTFRIWSNSDFSVRNISRHSTHAGDTSSVSRFAELGGVFLTGADVLCRRLESIRGLVFDWDGVFNKGIKGPGAASRFSEADSMGTNLLRYALWIRSQTLPATAIITGEVNPGAELFARREHFDALFQGVKDKAEAIDRFCSEHALERSQLICVFDDINDLGMAAGCGVRLLVRRDASPMLQGHLAREGCCDYISAAEAGEYAVRELSELLVELMGLFDTVVRSRVAVDDDYSSYFSARQAVQTRVSSLAG